MVVSPDDAAVQEVLDLLSHAPLMTAVRLRLLLSHGHAEITLRKTAQQDRHTLRWYWWEAIVLTTSRVYECSGPVACETAEGAYRAAVDAVHAILERPSAGDG